MRECDLGMLKYYLFLILLAIVSCGPIEKENYSKYQSYPCKIRSLPGLVNSTRTDKFPAVVPVETEKGFCTGTIIGKCTVLTAAHCFSNKEHIVRIHVGDSIYDETQWVKVHPQYKNPGINDLTIIRFEYQIVETDPIAISLVEPKEKEEIILVGYGTTETSGAGLTNKTYGYNNINRLSQTEMEFVSPGATVLPGDSGGPVLRKEDNSYSQIGINVTYVDMGSFDNRISYALRLDYYYMFIIEDSLNDILFRR